ncbi:DUF1003 domain-containing protein [Alicyclobacillus acidocaldarius]|uniref:DUF1003 domain-containing protein n=1 Tax=Alicyclobacillus acidocaldarius (strain Tc-4-1) TaxID=1048834 RepID=F8IG68_ALIAT|nr:DUF1003 domain-containing protein [Alicyclobacillus acidocaldarius]AEJ44221.1 protein of unknown function DUF1003 [Alicyclobacillus acidocaldarius subsp. acidocaldarius Tc-4-1]MCL6442798.1 DUF1003 domain-containing protein [Alicyclobacillus sp.]
MAKRYYYVYTDHDDDNANLEGFDIPINEGDAKRIARLVNLYEENILSMLDEEYQRKTKWSDKLADRIAAFGGSWTFIIIFATLLVSWMVWNAVPGTRRFHFDPPPFILLNLCLSFLAAFQAPIIMMSQNRQAARDKHEAIIDFAINYKAEQEIDDMQSHLHRIEGKLLQLERLLKRLDAVVLQQQEERSNAKRAVVGSGQRVEEGSQNEVKNSEQENT